MSNNHSPRSPRPNLWVKNAGLPGPPRAQKGQRLYVPRRCSVGEALKTALSWIAPNLPQGKLRLEAGLAYDAARPGIRTNFAVEVSNFNSRYYDRKINYSDGREKPSLYKKTPLQQEARRRYGDYRDVRINLR